MHISCKDEHRTESKKFPQNKNKHHNKKTLGHRGCVRIGITISA